MNPADQTQEAVQSVIQNNHGQMSSALTSLPYTGSPFSDRDEQVGLHFASTEELDAAIDWLWTDARLRDLPRVHVGCNTMIVPSRSVDLFRARGYHFTLSSVVSAGDLLPEDINRIRRQGSPQPV